MELSEKVEQSEIGNSLTLLWGTWELWCDVAPSNEQEKITTETSPLGAESTFTQGQPRYQSMCNNTYSNNKKINEINNDYNTNMFINKNEVSKINNSSGPNTNQDKVENWLDRVRSIGLFDSAEGFWGLHDCIVEPSQLPIGTSYYLFRKHVAPMWEHEANRRGGKWVITFTQPSSFSSSSSSSVLHSYNLNLFQAFASSRAKSSQHSCNQNNYNDSTKEKVKSAFTSSVPQETLLSATNMQTSTSPLFAQHLPNNDNNHYNNNVDSDNMNTEANHTHLKDETNMMPVDVAWERLCLAVIGELLPCDEEEICGIVVSKNKPKSTALNNSHFTSYSKNGINNSSNAGEWKLSLWTRTADDEETQMQIAAYIAKLLSFDPSCQYNNTNVTNKDNNDDIKESNDDVVDAIDNKQQSNSDTLPYSAERQGKKLQSMLPSTLFTGNISYVVHRELMLAKQQTNKINYAQAYVFKPRYTYIPPREKLLRELNIT